MNKGAAMNEYVKQAIQDAIRQAEFDVQSARDTFEHHQDGLRGAQKRLATFQARLEALQEHAAGHEA